MIYNLNTKMISLYLNSKCQELQMKKIEKSSISRIHGKNLHKDHTESKPELKTKKKMTEDT